MATTDLPNLVLSQPITEADGKPTLVYHKWWQSFKDSLSSAITTLQQQVLDIQSAFDQIADLDTSKQPYDDALTALSGLDGTLGLVEQTGVDTFAKRALGVAASTSALTRADGDARYEPLGGGGSGDFVGPASATDNAIVRFDTTTGKLGQNSTASIDDDGVIRSSTNSAANIVSVPLVNWCMLTADYVLSNVGTEQKLFNTTTNGTLALPAGVYSFEYWLYILTMSATSGNAAIDPIGAGTAVTNRWGQDVYGIDNSAALNAGTQTGSGSVTQQTTASALSAGTGAGMKARGSGMFRISTGGTIIPSITLVTAAAATVKAGSWFRVEKIGESSETYLGNWT